MTKEPMVITEEQYLQFAPILDEVERLRKLTRTEKERIIRDILDRPFIDLTCDWAFRHVFGHNPEILKMLLNDLLPEKIVSLEYDPNEIDRTTVKDKNIIMDVFCHTEDGRRIVVEVQKQDHDGFSQRMLYYGAARLREQLEPGDDYSLLCPVYVICFMDFTLPHEGVDVPPGKLMFCYRMIEEQTGELYGNNWLNVIFCELPRIHDDYLQKLNPQEQWFAVLRNIRNFAEKPEWLDARFDPLMDLARTKRLTQEEITKYLQSMVSEREKRDIGNAYYRRGLKDGETRGMEKGMEKGIEKGIEIKALETARTMIADGVPVQQIAKWTGLTEEQIQGGIETTSQR